jgi:hypothetical protein
LLATRPRALLRSTLTAKTYAKEAPLGIAGVKLLPTKNTTQKNETTTQINSPQELDCRSHSRDDFHVVRIFTTQLGTTWKSSLPLDSNSPTKNSNGPAAGLRPGV